MGVLMVKARSIDVAGDPKKIANMAKREIEENGLEVREVAKDFLGRWGTGAVIEKLLVCN